MFFEYKVLIVYREFTKEYIKEDFRIFAKDEDNAKKIAKEVLYLKGGSPVDDLQYVVKVVTPKDEICTNVIEIVKPLYNRLLMMYKDKNYTDFVELFIKLDGYAAKFDRKHKIKEYICRYNEIDVKVSYDFENDTPILDSDFIILNKYETTYFIKDNFETVLNCKA